MQFFPVTPDILMIVQSDLKLRQHDAFPAKREGKLPAMLERAIGGWRASLEVEYRGITADDRIVPDLFRVDAAGTSCELLTAAARSYLALLSPEQTARGLFPLDAKEWRSWSNVHPFLMRHGLCLDDLAEDQRHAALDVLREALSDDGFKAARDIMRMSEHNREVTGRPEEYGEWFYWFSIMGTPSDHEPWGWQIDGHHLIINCLVVGGQMVLAPVFMGAEPVFAKVGKYAGTRVLQAEEGAGMALLRSLTADEKKNAIVDSKPPRDVLVGAFADNIRLAYEGVRYQDLSGPQQALFDDLIKIYLRRMRPDHAAVKREEIYAHIDETYFVWMGEYGDDSPFYYRVHSPVLLIEFDHLLGLVLDNDQPTRNHIHTTVRTPNGNDYGKALLRELDATRNLLAGSERRTS